MRRTIAWTATAAGALAVAVLVGSVVRSAPALPTLPPDALLQKTIAAVENPPAFHGTLQFQSQLALPQTTADPAAAPSLGNRIARVWHNTPNLWRVETYTSEGATDSQLTVADGHSMLTWNAQTNTYRLRPQPTAKPMTVPGIGQIDRWLSEAQGTSSLTLDANATVAGQAAYHLVITPSASDVLVGNLQLWIDGQTFLPLQVELTDRSGAVVASAAFSDIAYGSSAASLFSTQPPSGSTEAPATAPKATQQTHSSALHRPHEHLTPAEQLTAAQAQVDFALGLPHDLPGNRVLTGASARTGSVTLRFGQAWQTLLLVESRKGQALPAGEPVSVNGASGLLLSERVVSAVSWTEGGLHYTLAGSLAPDVLLNVARSVR